jgi:hypothetical protein
LVVQECGMVVMKGVFEEEEEEEKKVGLFK